MEVSPDYISLESWQAVHRELDFGHHFKDDEAIRNAYEQTYNETHELLQKGVIQEGNFVLDIGSGNARMGLGLQAYPIGKYIGLDPIQASIQFSKAALGKDKRFSFKWVDWKNEQYNPKGKLDPAALRLPVKSQTVDAVLCMSLFSHLETLSVAQRYVDEIFRVLKPGGRFFSSWFRSPPNAVTASAFRTVYPEPEIRQIMAKFVLFDERGGLTDGFNDQWCLFAQRPVT